MKTLYTITEFSPLASDEFFEHINIIEIPFISVYVKLWLIRVLSPAVESIFNNFDEFCSKDLPLRCDL